MSLAVLDWQDGAVAVLAFAAVWVALWLRRRGGGGGGCANCSGHGSPPPA